ncbi:MAG TPA: UDP-N-acetylmuramoyl-tripeptide--D-alanyl-D-alanine ligase [Chitinophagaceae bacterium]
MNTPELYEIFKRYPSVQTDTRKLSKGDIFFALKGPNFNGNEFAKKAIEDGASCAVIDEGHYQIPDKTILVADVLTSLQQLAKYHRAQFSIPFLAITGSNGKTTTKELIHSVLATTYQTYTTEGNLNNHIGIPLTILKIKNDAGMAVIEMGANHIGEIASYCQIAMPSHGLITNCGKAHLEGFGSEEGVRKAKGELFDYLRTLTHSFAFVMWDYEYLQQMSKGISGIIKYGTKGDAHVIGKALKNDPLLEIEILQGLDEKKIKTQLVGEYNLPNVLAAVTVGNFFKVPESKIRLAIENYSPSNSRSQLIQKGGNKIVLDAYNANPSSMKLAIDNFAKMPGDGILVLGSMAELGKESEKEHSVLIEQIKTHQWKEVVLVGSEFQKINHPFMQFRNSSEVKDWFQKQKFEDSNILIKGSRSMQMEKVIEE